MSGEYNDTYYEVWALEDGTRTGRMGMELNRTGAQRLAAQLSIPGRSRRYVVVKVTKTYEVEDQ